jgi:hypothetical protein
VTTNLIKLPYMTKDLTKSFVTTILNLLMSYDHILDTKLCCHKPDNKLGRVLRIVDPSFLLATSFLHLQALRKMTSSFYMLQACYEPMK